MKHLLPLVALAALSACNQSSEPAAAANNTAEQASANTAAPVELPPAITAEKTFRCKDNSLVYVTFFQGDRQVVVRTEENGTPTTLRAPTAGEPYVADGGWSLTGDQTGVTVTAPDAPARTCRS